MDGEWSMGLSISVLLLPGPSWISSVCHRSWWLTLPLPPSYAFRISVGGWGREGWKNDEPDFTRTFLDRCIFNSLQAEEGVQWGPLVILVLSEDTWTPGGLIADDKVTRLRVNLCYPHLITVSCVLVPVDRSPLQPSRLQWEGGFWSYLAVSS